MHAGSCTQPHDRAAHGSTRWYDNVPHGVCLAVTCGYEAVDADSYFSIVVLESCTDLTPPAIITFLRTATSGPGTDLVWG